MNLNKVFSGFKGGNMTVETYPKIEEQEEVADDLSGAIGAKLTAYLFVFVAEHKLGTVFNADTDFELPGIGKRRPDIAFCTYQTFNHFSRSAVPVPPDLAVEVVSSRDEFDKLSQKLQEYKQAQVKLIWVVRPLDKEIEVRKADGSTALLNINDTLKGEDLIPNFELTISKLFEGLAT
jgi:Uma2 family endonuclease